jgi:hypothetical protein
MVFFMKVKFLNNLKKYETFKIVIIAFVIMQRSISNFGNIVNICKTYLSSLMENKTPKFSLINGL